MIADRPLRDRVKAAIRFEIDDVKRHAWLVEPQEGWDAICRLIEEGALGDEVNSWAPRADRPFFRGSRSGPGWGYWPLLAWAAATGPPGLVAALLRAGADPMLGLVPGAPPDALRRGPPIFWAIHRPAVVTLLLDAGAEPNAHEDAIDRIFPLYSATQYPETVRVLLERGADPLAQTATGQTALGNAIAMGDRESARLLREACWARIKDQRGTAIEIKRSKKKYDVSTERGVADYTRRFYQDGLQWLVILSRAPVEQVARCISEESGASRWEQDARERHVLDGAQVVFVLRLRGRPLTLAFVVSGAPSMPSGQPQEASKWAARLSERTEQPSIVFETLGVQVFRDGQAVEREGWDLENDVRYEDASATAFEREQRRARDEMLAWFERQGIFIPPAEDASDGLLAKLALRGVKKTDVERIDVVVLAEYST